MPGLCVSLKSMKSLMKHNVQADAGMMTIRHNFRKALILTALCIRKIFLSFSSNSIISTTNAAHFQKQTKWQSFQSQETFLLQLCVPATHVPGLYSRGSECLFGTGGYHAVSILYPWASPQQWPTWESRPGGGINQLPPSLGGLLPAHHAAAPGRALLGSIPMRACWNSQRWE